MLRVCTISSSSSASSAWNVKVWIHQDMIQMKILATLILKANKKQHKEDCHRELRASIPENKSVNSYRLASEQEPDKHKCARIVQTGFVSSSKRISNPISKTKWKQSNGRTKILQNWKMWILVSLLPIKKVKITTMQKTHVVFAYKSFSQTKCSKLWTVHQNSLNQIKKSMFSQMLMTKTQPSTNIFSMKNASQPGLKRNQNVHSVEHLLVKRSEQW